MWPQLYLATLTGLTAASVVIYTKLAVSNRITGNHFGLLPIPDNISRTKRTPKPPWCCPDPDNIPVTYKEKPCVINNDGDVEKVCEQGSYTNNEQQCRDCFRKSHESCSKDDDVRCVTGSVCRNSVCSGSYDKLRIRRQD